jgi:hypothetical protein
MNIKEELMIAPVVYTTVGSCGVAMLRRSGDYPNVLRAVLSSENSALYQFLEFMLIKSLA